MRSYRAGALLAMLAMSACGRGADSGPEAERPGDDAMRLAQKLLIVDTHIDVPYRLEDHPEDVGVATERGDFDYPRARKGGLDVAFFSIYTPSEKQGTGEEEAYADRLIDGVEALVARHPDEFALTTGVDDLRRKVAEGLLVLPLGMENGAPLGEDLSRIAKFHRRGVRYVTLTHGKANQLSDSSYDENRPWGGLSPFGERVVAEMNRVGIMVDVSHVSDAAFERVLAISKAPVIASHSSCRAFTPGWERNMSDEMIRALAEHGGVIQINFGSAFLDDRYRQEGEERRNAIETTLASLGFAPDSPAGKAFAETYRKEHPIEPVGIAAVADHIEHAVRLAGIDHVGLGSDFDGVGDSLPVGLEDVSAYPNLIRELMRRGMSEGDLAKICGENLLRVWAEVERTAAALQADRGT